MAMRGAAMVASMVLISGAADGPAGYRSRILAAHQHPRAGVPLTGRAAKAVRSEATAIEQEESADVRRSEFPITVRPGTLGVLVDQLAGHSIQLASARVVGVFDRSVFLVESQTRLLPIVDRDRVLVFVEAGALRVEPAALVASTVTLSGVARTLLGMQVSREVPWPPTLTPEVVKRLEIRAAILARSVRTPEGIDLLARPSIGKQRTQ